MKKNKMMLFVLVLGTFIVYEGSQGYALSNGYIVNNNGISIYKNEYANLLNLGFTDEEIYNMHIAEFENNKNLKGNIVSQNIVYLSEDNPQKMIGLYRIQNGNVTTLSKKLTTTIIEVNDKYRYKVSLSWITIPSTRSYDIIGIGMDTSVKDYENPTFQQNFCYSNNNCSSSNTYTINSSASGIGVSFKLPTQNLVSLNSYMYYDVLKRNNAVLTSQNAYGDYAHAIRTISESDANNYFVNRSGILLDSSIANYYDSMQTAIARWTGSW